MARVLVDRISPEAEPGDSYQAIVVKTLRISKAARGKGVALVNVVKQHQGSKSQNGVLDLKELARSS